MRSEIDSEVLTYETENSISDVMKCAENLRYYMGRSRKMFHRDAQEYIRELRNFDRD